MMKKLAVVLVLLLSASAFAQFRNNGDRSARSINQGNGPTGGACLVYGSPSGYASQDATPRKIDRSGFVYARLRYHVSPYWRGGEVPWHHDYPDGDTMLPDSLSRLTSVNTKADSFQIVDVDSKELFKYPFVYMSEAGYLDLLPNDVKNLREYLDRGGFLFVDDFRGNESDMSEMQNFIEQLIKLYPDRMLVPLPASHPIFHSFFEVDPMNMLPPYTMRNSGKPQFLGLSDDKGRLQIMVDFNNDASEYWQALDVGVCSIHEASTAVQLGINYAIYAMSH